ncbi:tRNA-dihydrouridine synthase family protein [uncultured Bacteroides sp.]|uniref:tRNA-dihydrouridine synthase family protein n=1 Tax=uncultured Bacteroides sp. TaxID=162156 RepID=UPI00262C98DD|nr:tRNA-dihydrouridine synthase family protein [uncultured Bacteroides sp.]
MLQIDAAPLQGFTESAWRNAHEQVFGGVDAYYTPFVRLEKGEIRNKDRREVSPERNKVRHLIPQIVAGEPDEFCRLTDYLYSLGYREIDLNMGCPFPLIANRGKGSGILPYPERVDALLKTMEHYPDIRFSVKMRLGWKDSDEWKLLLPLLNRSCVKQLTLHPRIGKQQYKGDVDMEAFSDFYNACELPLLYNGNLISVSDIRQLTDAFPKLQGVMLGRGLLADPSLASAFREGVVLSKAALYGKVYEMHRLMTDEYVKTIEGGDAQLLQKLKTMWEYLLPDMDKKVRKSILKSNRLDVYLRSVETALHG